MMGLSAGKPPFDPNWQWVTIDCSAEGCQKKMEIVEHCLALSTPVVFCPDCREIIEFFSGVV